MGVEEGDVTPQEQPEVARAPRPWYRSWWVKPALVAFASYILLDCARVGMEPTASDCKAQEARVPGKNEALEGYPWICGVQELAAEVAGPVRVFAFTQPTGSWCWSNGGLIIDDEAGAFSIVDAATDMRLTKRMKEAYSPLVDGLTPMWLLFTHGDLDHAYGSDMMTTLGRLGMVAHNETAKMIAKQPRPQQFALSINRGRFLWALLAPKGQPRWLLRGLLAALPGPLFEHAIGFLGKLRACEFFAPFHFDEVTRFIKPTHVYDEHLLDLSLGGQGHQGNMVVMHKVDGAHSAGDTFVDVHSKGVVFAGDLLFIGVSPIMWEGPAETFIEALEELLDTEAKLFVPGHGPVTDRGGVEASIDYWEYVAEGTKACLQAGVDAHPCGLQMLADLPRPWRDWADPERILINVVVQMGHLRDPGNFKVKGSQKFGLIQQQGTHLLKQQLGYL